MSGHVGEQDQQPAAAGRRADAGAPPPDRMPGAVRLGRRGVVAGAGVVLVGAAASAHPVGRRVLELWEAAQEGRLEAPPVPDGVLPVQRLRRPEDGFVADLVLFNLDIMDRDGQQYLYPVGDGQGFLSFVLPGQSLGEQAVSPLAGTKPIPVLSAELAQPTVIAFTVPSGTFIPYDLASLLEWGDWDALLSSDYVPGTFLEAPYRLQMRPASHLRWQHATTPRVHGGEGANAAAELWHTRLTGLNAHGDPDPRARRSTGVPEQVVFPDEFATPVTLPLAHEDRLDIVANSTPNATSGSLPVSADRVLLTPMGATLDLHGYWPRSVNNLESWDHRSTVGRDQYVKLVRRGFLAPWSHPAVWVQETWRAMVEVQGRAVAVLRRCDTIIVTEPVVDTTCEWDRIVSTPAGQKLRGLLLPFSSVRATQRQTPLLEALRSASQPQVARLANGALLSMTFVGTDHAGREVPFASAVEWVPEGSDATWNTTSQLTFPERITDLGGRLTALAPEPESSPGVVSVAMGAMLIAAVPVGSKQAAKQRRHAPFRPGVLGFQASSPGIDALSGGAPLAAGATTYVGHIYAKQYYDDAANPGGVVARTFPVPTVPLDPATGAGVVSLPTAYQGLSTKAGAVLASAPTAIGQLAAGVFTPAKVFQGVRLLGVLDLAKILQEVGDLAGTLEALPTSLAERLGERQTVTTSLSPQLKGATLGKAPFTLTFELREGASLRLLSTTSVGGDQPAESTLDATLEQVALRLGDYVRLPLKRLRVVAGSGTPFTVDLDLDEVEYLGPLKYVQYLAYAVAIFDAVAGGGARPLMPGSEPALTPGARGALTSARARRADGGALRSDSLWARQDALPPPDVDVTPQGLVLHQAVALPALPLGAFTISGLGFELGAVLDFGGGLHLAAAFASHENPFQVTYLCFGGGGYVAIGLSGAELEKVEVSLMVCGAFGLNLGVAAGAVSVQVGFVLALTAAKEWSLTAFFRAAGSLEVLGLVSLSVVFEISLAYQEADNTLTGTATLELKVEVLFVSKTVTASVTRTLAGSSSTASRPALRGGQIGDLTYFFDDTYPDQDTWAGYVGAFAPR